MKLFDSILLATNNPGKKKEITALLSQLGISVLSPSDLGIVSDPEETGMSFAENALIKAKALFTLAEGKPTLADDSGICVMALGGDPGVYSARYGGPDLNDQQRALYLLEKMKAEKNREAKYVCELCFLFQANNEIVTKTFQGELYGAIATEYDDGGNGFGYDPIFLLENGKRLSYIPKDEKNSFSHRGIALKKFFQFLSQT